MTSTISHATSPSPLDGVTRTYRSRAGEVHALRGVTHTFGRGTFTAVMGPSGSGKSTLLQVRGRARPADPAAGRRSAARPLGRLDEAALTRLRRTSMGFVFQSYNLLDALTAYDNVALPLGSPASGSTGPPYARALGAGRPRRPGATGGRPSCRAGSSSGSRSRARCITRPDVLFADEPTGALDRTHRPAGPRAAALRSSDQQGQTVVMVTHDPLAASYAHAALFLADGEIVGRLDRADAGRIAAAMSELER